MRMTVGGLRAGAFEAFEAPAKGEYIDKVIYLVEGVPGAWRRCKMPKGHPAESGLLAAFFDGQIIYLEHVATISEELAQYSAHTRAPDDARAQEAAEIVTALSEKRTEYVIRERGKNSAASGAPVANAGETVQPETSVTTSPTPDVPAAGEATL